jgi:EAL domain-containing protein (putative c-di-GMP-specific phosphodiesterase class I)
VNLSAVQFFEPILIGRVMNALAATGLAPDRLEIEITETVFLKGTVGTLSMLDRLRQLGVSIALDDFGIGYSSLSYLRTLPIHKIKIDRSFVHELDTSSESAAIVRMIVELAKTLDLSITAEGVETEAQRQLLDEFGCGQAQGYLFGRPASAAVAFERAMADATQVEAPSAAA